MIRHIVLFSAKNPDDVPAIKSGLEKLAEIPGSRHFEVKLNAKRDMIDNSIDIVLYSEFDDYKTLDAYQKHPQYKEAIKNVRPLRDIRIAVDVET